MRCLVRCLVRWMVRWMARSGSPLSAALDPVTTEVVVARSSRAKWTACEYSERQFVQRASEAKCEF